MSRRMSCWKSGNLIGQGGRRSAVGKFGYMAAQPVEISSSMPSLQD